MIDLQAFFCVAVALSAALFGFWGAMVADGRGHSKFVGFLLGAAMAGVGLLIVIALPPGPRALVRLNGDVNAMPPAP